MQLNNGAKQDDSVASYKLEVEAKPIKGACARVIPANGKTRTGSAEAEDVERAQTLQSSLKNLAKKLMNVDLLRNDLSRICETGSVHVAKLMDIESYATVHQMVFRSEGRWIPPRLFHICSQGMLSRREYDGCSQVENDGTSSSVRGSVGCLVGGVVGTLVGGSVGCLVGGCVGGLVGPDVGCLVRGVAGALIVGDSVGCLVGGCVSDV
jgi:hypothetical protein